MNNKEYEVPVWFRVSAENIDQAWWKIRRELEVMEQHDQLPPYVVEEPVELLTGAQGWNDEAR